MEGRKNFGALTRVPAPEKSPLPIRSGLSSPVAFEI